MPSSGMRVKLKKQTTKYSIRKVRCFYHVEGKHSSCRLLWVGLYKEKSSDERYSTIIWPKFLPVCSGIKSSSFAKIARIVFFHFLVLYLIMKHQNMSSISHF